MGRGAAAVTDDIYPSGRIVHHSYAPDGKLTGISSRIAANRPFKSYAQNFSSTTTDDRPYKEDLAYDAFSNITSLTGKFWNWPMTIGSAPPQAYVNNRNTHRDYDADGRVTNSHDVQYPYDAAGQAIETSESRSNILFSYDGDGKRIKSVNAITDTNVPPGTDTTTTYYLPSSVIGNNLTELDETGAKKQGYVYGGSGVFAVEKPVTTADKVMYRMSDAQGYQVRMTLNTGVVEPDKSAELDPFRTDAKLHALPTVPSHVPGEQTKGRSIRWVSAMPSLPATRAATWMERMCHVKRPLPPWLPERVASICPEAKWSIFSPVSQA